MNRNERYYQQIIGAIGYTMLLFLLLHNAFGLLLELLAIFLEQVPNPLASIAHQLFYAAGYLLSFMLPVSLLKRTVKEIDPDAFIIVQEAHQVLGDGFARYSKHAL